MNIDREIDILLEGLIQDIQYMNKDERYKKLHLKYKEIKKYVKTEVKKSKYLKKYIKFKFNNKMTKKLLNKGDCLLLFSVYYECDPKLMKKIQKDIDYKENFDKEFENLIKNIKIKFLQNTDFILTKDPFSYYLVLKGEKIDNTQKIV